MSGVINVGAEKVGHFLSSFSPIPVSSLVLGTKPSCLPGYCSTMGKKKKKILKASKVLLFQNSVSFYSPDKPRAHFRIQVCLEYMQNLFASASECWASRCEHPYPVL